MRVPAALPGVDLQRGLQELSALLLGLGQLLHAQEVAGGPHLQHRDHGRVRVQSESHLQARPRTRGEGGAGGRGPWAAGSGPSVKLPQVTPRIPVSTEAPPLHYQEESLNCCHTKFLEQIRTGDSLLLYSLPELL